MATTKKSTPRYDLNAQDRKRDRAIKLGLTALVILFAVGLVLFIVMNKGDKAASGEVKAVRVSSNALIKKDGADEPKAVLSIYEDFQCPHCKEFEKTFGSTINKIVESGAAAVDYYMVAILNKTNAGYSGRAANAGYCVGDENKDAFVRFHSALFAQQPQEGSGSGPDNAALIETARQAGAGGSVPDCVNHNKYTDMVKGLAPAAKITATPTIRLNGKDITPAKPEELISQITAIVGPLPALLQAAPAESPSASASASSAAPASPSTSAEAPVSASSAAPKP